MLRGSLFKKSKLNQIFFFSWSVKLEGFELKLIFSLNVS